MADTEQRSQNFVSTLLVNASSGVKADGPVALWADKTTHRLLVDAGTITTSSATAGATGSAVPASADYIGVNSGGNLVGLAYGQGTMANSLPVTIASNQSAFPIKLQDGSGTNITSTTGALDVNIKSGSSADTQYTDAAAAPAHPIGNAIAYNNAGTINTVSKAQPFPIVLTDASNSSQVSFVNGNVPVFINDNTSTGNITANAQQITNSTTGDAGASILITGTWVGTLQFEGSQDGSTFVQIPVIDMATGNTVTSTTGNSSYRLNVGGLSQIQVRSSAWTSGTAAIKIRCGPGVTPPTALPTGSNIVGKFTTDQTTHGTTDLVAADITKVGGAAVTLGSKTSVNSFPVVIASDQASIPVAATLAAETTKVIGTINIAASQTVGLVAGSAVIGHVIVDTAPTTAVTIASLPALAAGSALIGKVGIDQTTVGTTNAVSLAQLGSTTIATGNGVVGAGVQRVALASDNTGIANFGHGATGSAVPVGAQYQGGQARSSEITAATNGNLVGLITDLVGKLIVLPYANPENFVNGTTGAIVDTTSTSTIAAQGAGIRTYITSVIVTNSHATVGTFVKILDGTTIIAEGYAAAAGGGFVATFPTPLRGTANTAVNTQCVTTGANVISSVAGYKGV